MFANAGTTHRYHAQPLAGLATPPCPDRLRIRALLRRVRAQEILGAVAARTGSLTDARNILTSAAEEAAAFDPAAAVALLSDAVNACFYLGDSGWAMAVIDRSAAVLAAAGTARARILGLMAVGTAELLAGRGGMESVRRAVQMLSTSDELRDDPRRMAVLVLAPLFLRESGTGRELINSAVEESRRRSAIGTLPMLLFHVARDHAATDQWTTATSEYHETAAWPRSERARGPDPQELQIASMLAAGRSTKEAASALFLSPKTVEYHLRHVYTKLDVHSREELARKLNQ